MKEDLGDNLVTTDKEKRHPNSWFSRAGAWAPFLQASSLGFFLPKHSALLLLSDEQIFIYSVQLSQRTA